MSDIRVKKRDGSEESYDVSKITKVLKWAAEDINGVNVPDIEINAQIRLRDGITTREIHSLLVQSAADLISLDNPNYQIVASRLLTYALRKDVWGGKNPPKLIDFVKRNIDNGVYDSVILDPYSEAEINKLDEYIDHDRDFIFTYSGMRQMCDKYLVQNRNTKEIYETPQFAYMLIAMTVFCQYDGKHRLKYVKRAYDYFSRHKINLPTPLMAGVRTGLRQYASCCLIDVDDNMKSIFASVTATGFATAQRYGIGLNLGRMRPINSEIRNGEVIHTGVIPFLKVFESTVKSCHQNGIRGGSATVNFPFWHLEIEDILQLKNNAGTDDNRVRRLDYCIHFSKLFYKRIVEGGQITLFSPHETKDLYDAFGTDKFDDLYEEYESKVDSLKQYKVISARDLMTLFVKERVETGRIYFMNIDHVNEHGPWLDKVNMTNLCVEVTHPTIPIKDINDPNGEIGICILSAINTLEIQSDSELDKVCDVIVRMLDEIIDYQNYFCPAAERFTKRKRSLGVGITNLAAYFAKLNAKYTDNEAVVAADELMEKVQFFLLKSSNELAKEKGACQDFQRTKYAQGILPIDTYCKAIDEVCKRKPKMDWEDLRSSIKEHGLRNSTVSAIMPCESSSVIQNSTNGIEPIRSFITYKSSKKGSLPVIAPHYVAWKNRYTLAYEMEDNIGLINIIAALQKWVDMSISSNLYYNYSHYPNKILPDSKVIKELLYAYKMGIKTGYYNNTDDGDKQSVGSGCESGACAI